MANGTADRAAPCHLENPPGFLDERMLLMQSSRKEQIYVSKLPNICPFRQASAVSMKVKLERAQGGCLGTKSR